MANDVLKSVYFASGDKQQFINMHIVVTTKENECIGESLKCTFIAPGSAEEIPRIF